MFGNGESDDGGSYTAADQAQYVYESVKAIRGREDRLKAERLNAGWELISQSQGTLRTEMTFRREKPKTFLAQLLAFAAKRNPAIRRLEGNPTKRRRLAIACGGLALLMVIGIVIGVAAGGDDSAPSDEATKTAVGPSALPSTEPTPSEPAKTVAAADIAVVDLINDYIAERAAADVTIAKSVTNVSLRDRVLRVTFDPAKVGMDQETFDSINPFNNPYDPSESPADFVSTPMALSNDAGVRLRRAIDRVETMYADGTPDGSRTTDEIIKLNGLDE